MSSNGQTPLAPINWRLYCIWLAVLLIIPLVMLFRSRQHQPQRDGIINVERDDPEMTAAIAKARATLPQFWRVFDHPDHGERNFALKVAIRDGKQTEHFWANDLVRTNGHTMGTINNDPNLVKNVKLGERIVIPEADISDWTYARDGKMIGNYTLRALFKKMSPDEVEAYKRMMADP
jgi:uncharacterized protein YegJ (DUF2314 family)